MDYQSRCNSVKDENDNLLADSKDILNTRKNIFFQLLNVYKVSDVKQIEIFTAELLVPDPSYFEVEFAIAKLKDYKSPGSDQISAKLIQARGETPQSETYINSLIFIWSKEELRDQ
jgi:hypothetical protein